MDASPGDERVPVLCNEVQSAMEYLQDQVRKAVCHRRMDWARELASIMTHGVMAEELSPEKTP